MLLLGPLSITPTDKRDHHRLVENLWTPPATCSQVFARTLHSSQQLQEDIKLTVPSMGDSVSEGTVADFTKQPGKLQACSLAVLTALRNTCHSSSRPWLIGVDLVQGTQSRRMMS